MLRDWLILIWCKVQFTIDEEVSNSVYFFLIFKLKNLCNMVCLNQDPVNFKALTDNSRHCLESLSVVLHVYAEDECQSLWHNSNVSEREITLIANDSLNIIFCTHILTSELHTKSGICAICKINCNAKKYKALPYPNISKETHMNRTFSSYLSEVYQWATNTCTIN